MKIGFIGTGNMGAALARSAFRSEGNNDIYLSDFNTAKVTSLAEEIGGKVADNLSLCRECDFVFLGVKPQVLPALLSEISSVAREREGEITFVSMAAGVKTEAILARLGEKASLIRIMPNTPVLVGEGVIVYHAVNTSAEKEEGFVRLLSKAGIVEKLEESKIDAASALHGCGPAFVYLFIEALADGGVDCGLPRDKALCFAAQTVRGAAQMVLETGIHPGALKDAVCSPGGSTIEGVRALEEAGFRGAAMDAVLAAYEKTLELGK